MNNVMLLMTEATKANVLKSLEIMWKGLAARPPLLRRSFFAPRGNGKSKEPEGGDLLRSVAPRNI